MYNIDPVLVQSVIEVESNYDAQAIGAVGEIGLMQIRPEMWNIPKAKLYNPRFNVKIGVSLLSKARDQCAHQNNYTWIVCFNSGITGGSRIARPEHQTYYKKVMRVYERLKGEL